MAGISANLSYLKYLEKETSWEKPHLFQVQYVINKRHVYKVKEITIEQTKEITIYLLTSVVKEYYR